MNTTRSAHAAADGSWVTMTSVRAPSSTVRRSNASTSPGPGVERAGGLVGEDHVGLPDERPGDRDALLLAARQLGGTVRTRSPSPTPSSAARIVARGTRRPASRDGSDTFCSAVSAPSRLKDWNTKPMRSRRSRASAFSDNPSRF